VPISQQRTQTLKSSRSMSSMSKFRQVSSPRRSNDVAVPPLPPLPQSAFTTSLSKPLPPSPTPRSSLGRLPPQQPPPLPKKPPPPAPEKKVKLTKRKGLTPPELEHIPRLLPVFAELVRDRFLCRVYHFTLFF
jgi:hypothetical protein